jgi:rubredoxin
MSPETGVEDAGGQRWTCDACAGIYDPLEGDPEREIAPGTFFEDLPKTWACSICGAKQDEFRPFED